MYAEDFVAADGSENSIRAGQQAATDCVSIGGGNC